MYVEDKKIGRNSYYYLKQSTRAGNKVKTRTVAYLGKKPMNKKELKSKIEKIKQELKEAEDINKDFLGEIQLNELERLRNDFKRKLKRLDEKLIEDMFRDFKTFYIYNTNAIEGNTLTLEETNLLLNENKTPEGNDLKEIYDHINEKDAFDFILKNKPEINNELIVKLHSMLLGKIDKRVGYYRQHNVRVFGASFETSPAVHVKADMSILLKWYSKNKGILHPLVLAAIFHEKFERIHPFYDGNGRTGRILSNLILLQRNYPPLIIENARRKDYYKVLSAAHKADLTKTDVKLYKQIVDFFYAQLCLTYKKVFSKWG